MVNSYILILMPFSHMIALGATSSFVLSRSGRGGHLSLVKILEWDLERDFSR